MTEIQKEATKQETFQKPKSHEEELLGQELYDDFESKQEGLSLYKDKADLELEKQQRREQKQNLQLATPGELAPIKKNLYIESSELARMTEADVNKFRKFNGDIKVRGVACPKPVTNWY